MKLSPSSLIFVMIVAGWAAYLVPQWVRRREHLVASRTHDRHSRGTRVLEPRAARSHPDGASTGPILRRRGSQADAGGPGTEESNTEESNTDESDSEESSVSDAEYAAEHDLGGADGEHQVLRAHGRSPAARAARRRLLVLLVLVGLSMLSVAAAFALPTVPGWAALPSVVLLVLDVVAIVVTAPGRQRPASASGASIEAADGDAGYLPEAQVSGKTHGHVAQERVAHRHLPHEREAHEARPARWGRPARLTPATADPRVRTQAQAGGTPGRADQPAACAPTAAPATPEPPAHVETPSAQPEAAKDSTWTPVPVPKPTYTLKPAAPRAAPMPLAAPEASVRLAESGETEQLPTVQATVVQVPVVEEAPPKLDLEAVLERRRAANG